MNSLNNCEKMNTISLLMQSNYAYNEEIIEMTDFKKKKKKKKEINEYKK